jgi:thiol-disulfide isomerase/thioredoxin
MRFHLLFSLLLLVSGLLSQGFSYEEGLLRCDSVKAEINKRNEAMEQTSRLKADCLTGAMLPDFIATTMDGKTIDRSYFLGKVTLINFWMKSCGPCISEIPGLNKLKDEFGNEKVNFLAIGRCNEDEAKTFLAKHPWNFDHVKTGLPLIEDVFKFGWGYPVMMLVNKQGQIVMAFNGGVVGDQGQIVHDRLKPRIQEELAK